jgi:hypothetical protein
MLPLVDCNGEIRLEPYMIVDWCLTKKIGRSITEVLIRWKGAPVENDSWEILWKLQIQYPHVVGKVL